MVPLEAQAPPALSVRPLPAKHSLRRFSVAILCFLTGYVSGCFRISVVHMLLLNSHANDFNAELFFRLGMVVLTSSHSHVAGL